MDRSINFRGIAGSAGNIMQGMGKFVFGNEGPESKEDRWVYLQIPCFFLLHYCCNTGPLLVTQKMM
jgi:hypothetical protein